MQRILSLSQTRPSRLEFLCLLHIQLLLGGRVLPLPVLWRTIRGRARPRGDQAQAGCALKAGSLAGERTNPSGRFRRDKNFRQVPVCLQCRRLLVCTKQCEICLPFVFLVLAHQEHNPPPPPNPPLRCFFLNAAKQPDSTFPENM